MVDFAAEPAAATASNAATAARGSPWPQPRIERPPPHARAAAPPAVTAAYYLSTADDRLRRVSANADVARYTDPWSADCACPLGGRLALGARRLWVTRPAAHRLAALDVDDGRADELAKAGAVGLWPADIAADPDGGPDVFAADSLGGAIRRYRPGDGVPAAAWQAGVLAGPRRLAAGRTAEGLAVVAALLTDGRVRGPRRPRRQRRRQLPTPAVHRRNRRRRGPALHRRRRAAHRRRRAPGRARLPPGARPDADARSERHAQRDAGPRRVPGEGRQGRRAR
ncbi:MAG: hypothetical protein U0470_12895 [Anaerolineae bacterium]